MYTTLLHGSSRYMYVEYLCVLIMSGRTFHRSFHADQQKTAVCEADEAMMRAIRVITVDDLRRAQSTREVRSGSRRISRIRATLDGEPGAWDLQIWHSSLSHPLYAHGAGTVRCGW